jgi:hypothetical protein
MHVPTPSYLHQMIEEDLFFPGGSPDPPSLSRTPTPVPASCPAMPPSSSHHLPNEHSANDKRNLLQHGSATMANTATFSPHIYLSSPPTTMGSTSILTLPTSDTANLPGSSNSLHSDGSRPVSGPPLNPRDHSLLEYIYAEMHASRFINLSPLSLLANSLPVYFKSELPPSFLGLDSD